MLNFAPGVPTFHLKLKLKWLELTTLNHGYHKSLCKLSDHLESDELIVRLVGVELIFLLHGSERWEGLSDGEAMRCYLFFF